MGLDEKYIMLTGSMARNHHTGHFHCHHLQHWKKSSEEDVPMGPRHCWQVGKNSPFLSLLFSFIFFFFLEITSRIAVKVRHQLSVCHK